MTGSPAATDPVAAYTSDSRPDFTPFEASLGTIRGFADGAGLRELIAAGARLPTIFQIKENAMAGGLMSYGPSLPELFRRAATYIDKILKGTRPSDLPVEQPETFELVINVRTAKALGLTIPQSLLLRADGVIE